MTLSNSMASHENNQLFEGKNRPCMVQLESRSEKSDVENMITYSGDIQCKFSVSDEEMDKVSHIKDGARKIVLSGMEITEGEDSFTRCTVKLFLDEDKKIIKANLISRIRYMPFARLDTCELKPL
jgi:hypothetical protein